MNTPEKILAMSWDRRIPVDPAGMAERMGCTVAILALGCVATRRGKVVTLSKTLTPMRRRLALAHCLAHIALGHPDHEETAASFSSTATSADREANRFALELLMPAGPFASAMRSAPAEGGIESVAAMFGVPAPAALERSRMPRGRSTIL